MPSHQVSSTVARQATNRTLDTTHKKKDPQNMYYRFCVFLTCFHPMLTTTVSSFGTEEFQAGFYEEVLRKKPRLKA